jgi:hypothetical protein
MMNKIILAIAALTLVLAGCTKSENGTGRLVVKVTDDPFNISWVESATVTITKIEIRKAGLHEGNPFIVLSEDTVSFDLINLRNGLTKEILDLEIPEGKYDLIRLYVDEAGLKIREHLSPFKVKVPGGRQTGIKIFITPVLEVSGGLTSELLLDFDLARSFVMRGNLTSPHGVNGFIFKPCIRATNNSIAGRIEGMVTDTLKVKIVNAKVWLAKDTVISTAFTDTIGHYAITGVPAGTYTLSATKEGYDTVSFSGLKILAGNRTVQSFALTKK